MADSGFLVRPSKTQPQKAQQNPTTPFASFIYKAAFVCVLIAILPIFASQSPELAANKTIITRSWELLHLLLVGIAISYGLFSRRNSDHDADKDAQPKHDTTPHSYVSRVLQVPSVFDDDDEEAVESPRAPELPDETLKSQTWNYSQYNPGEPVVMVAKERTTEGSKAATTKPLFLPVRSLKSVGGDEDGGGKAGVVLPSPIPWRSRSGRMEVKEKEAASPPISAFEEAELCPPPTRVPSFRSSSTPPQSSASRLSPSPSVSSEIRAKTSEDSGRKKGFHRSSPPPAPPPPPLPLVHGHHNIGAEKKYGSKSFKHELEHLSTRGRERPLRSREELGLDPSEANTDPHGGRSVRSKQAQRLRTLPANKSKKKKNEFREKMIIESDSSHSDAESEMSDVGELSSSASAGAGPEENEVDKKADEFIAKFREQIRLQRIASIKRSTAQRNVRSQS